MDGFQFSMACALVILGFSFAFGGGAFRRTWLSRAARWFSFTVTLAGAVIYLASTNFNFYILGLCLLVMSLRAGAEVMSAAISGEESPAPLPRWFDLVLTSEVIPLGILAMVSFAIGGLATLVNMVLN